MGQPGGGVDVDAEAEEGPAFIDRRISSRCWESLYAMSPATAAWLLVVTSWSEAACARMARTISAGFIVSYEGEDEVEEVFAKMAFEMVAPKRQLRVC